VSGISCFLKDKQVILVKEPLFSTWNKFLFASTIVENALVVADHYNPIAQFAQ